jgi:FixJ family two-component response regulator
MRSAPLEAGLTGIDYVSSARAKKNMIMDTGRPFIAIVDDDVSVCRAMKRLLSSHDMDTAIFTSGRDFIDSLDAKPLRLPDCVILDIRMPGLSGLQVQKLLASKHIRTSIIFVTGESQRKIGQALAAGAAAVLEKPLDADVVLPTLRWVLGIETRQRF